VCIGHKGREGGGEQGSDGGAKGRGRGERESREGRRGRGRNGGMGKGGDKCPAWSSQNLGSTVYLVIPAVNCELYCVDRVMY